ncbi:MAG: response regulator transcription factor [Chloroflexota bacterium]|nr:response regulator transcription factor [Chloroflexota bacterium]
MTLKVLIAEDAEDVAEVVAFGVRMTWPGCQVTLASSGEEALASFEKDPADLVILDVAMPPPDGFEVCRRIREASLVPILMLTVRDATIDKVRALDFGADDYLTKPFDHLELLARLRALMRRTSGHAGQPQAAFVSGDLSIDFASHQVWLGEQEVRLTSIEYRLLEELARNVGMTLPHHVLLERVWGSEWVSDPSYLKVFVRRLRRKLGDDAERPRFIETVWGTGYRFLAPQ